MAKQVKVENDVGIPLSILASEILHLSQGMKTIEEGKLSKRAIILLLQDAIGTTKITRLQIELVLDYLPRLKEIYLRKERV